MKLIALEIERNKLIEKVSELKEQYLHMRCVILQFMKSLDLRYLSADSEEPRKKLKASWQCSAISSSIRKKKEISCCSPSLGSFWAFFDLFVIFWSFSLSILDWEAS